MRRTLFEPIFPALFVSYIQTKGLWDQWETMRTRHWRKLQSYQWPCEQSREDEEADRGRNGYTTLNFATTLTLTHGDEALSRNAHTTSGLRDQTSVFSFEVWLFLFNQTHEPMKVLSQSTSWCCLKQSNQTVNQKHCSLTAWITTTTKMWKNDQHGTKISNTEQLKYNSSWKCGGR